MDEKLTDFADRMVTKGAPDREEGQGCARGGASLTEGGTEGRGRVRGSPCRKRGTIHLKSA